MFVVAGPEPVRWMVARGFRVFLDLKFHDIPNTVAQACAAATRLGVWMLNVHAAGGTAMMRAARAAVDETAAGHGRARPLLIAVTVLTSLGDDDLRATGINERAPQQAQRLARLTADSGLDGVVCSAIEAPSLRSAIGPRFTLVTPGIRPAGSPKDDQARIITPEAAIANGADYLVIGRPITQARRSGRGARRHQRIAGEASMKITMIGTGYVGLVTGTCLAEVGNDVLCLDVDARKIEILNQGGVPIHEPGLAAMIARNVAAGRLRFTTDQDAAVAHGSLQFIAVGTPPGRGRVRRHAVRSRGGAAHRPPDDRFKIVVDKSTVPVGYRGSRARGDRRRAAGARRRHAVRRRVESGIPEGGRRGRGLHAAGPDRDRRRRRARDRRDARRLRAVPAQPRAVAGHGRALGRAHQVRGERDARHDGFRS